MADGGDVSAPSHERQSLALCAVHAVNNVLQLAEGERFSQDDFDRICEELSERKWFNPHRSWLGIGYYDVNIIMAAMQRRGYDVTWFDARMGMGALPDITADASVLGIIANKEYRSMRLLFSRTRHWFAFRCIGGVLFNLDSKLREPAVVESMDALRKLLASLVEENGHVLLVRRAAN